MQHLFYHTIYLPIQQLQVDVNLVQSFFLLIQVLWACVYLGHGCQQFVLLLPKLKALGWNHMDFSHKDFSSQIHIAICLFEDCESLAALYWITYANIMIQNNFFFH